MIHINLLPEALRKRGGLPMSQLVGLLVAVAVLGGLVYMVTKYQMDIIPSLRERQRNLQSQKEMLEKKAKELAQINAEINRMSGYVNAVKGLYKQRVVWSKVLSDIKNIVNFDPSMSEYNSDMRYLWLTRLTGKDKKINLEGYATSSSQVLAMQLSERLINNFRTYVPTSLPEKDEEVRLQEELRQAIAEHEAERRERPELPMQGPRELTIRQRLDEIKNIKSGGIAMMPFNSLLEDGSLKLNKTTWASAPKPRNIKDGVGEQLFPTMAWSFSIEMLMK